MANLWQGFERRELHGAAGDVVGGTASIAPFTLGAEKGAEGESGILRPRLLKWQARRCSQSLNATGVKAKVAGAVRVCGGY